MKGFMIYETPLWGDEENTVYLQEVKNASYTLKRLVPMILQVISKPIG